MSSSCTWCKLFKIRRLISHIGNPIIMSNIPYNSSINCYCFISVDSTIQKDTLESKRYAKNLIDCLTHLIGSLLHSFITALQSVDSYPQVTTIQEGMEITILLLSALARGYWSLPWSRLAGCEPNFCPTLGMQLKVWLVCKHPSHLGMQLNVLFTKSSSAVAVFAVSLSRRQNGSIS